MSSSAGCVAPSKVRLTSENETLPEPAGSFGASAGIGIPTSRSRIWKMRAPDAVERWAADSMYPSVRIGEINMSR
jgi:hypothetical protein